MGLKSRTTITYNAVHTVKPAISVFDVINRSLYLQHLKKRFNATKNNGEEGHK